ncbi:MAG TPA: PIN domain-containing protein [Pyrinomonadaceae bacterium]|jgi:predicted nucleic acid-binding protein
MLLDTSGLMCIFDMRDFRHADAIAFYDGATRLLTHNYVVAEFVALAEARGMPRRKALEFVVDLLSDTEIEVVWIDESLTKELYSCCKNLTINFGLCAMQLVFC